MMTRTLASLLLAASLLAAPAAARAQDRGQTGPGIGGEMTLTGIPTAVFVYDGGVFHIDVLFGMASVENGPTGLDVGGRFYYVVHGGLTSDFSVGGGLLVEHLSRPSPQPNLTNVHLELGGKIRAFVVPNVALTATLGLGVELTDSMLNDVVVIGSRLVGGFGIAYFFY
jgi:hypothetical protein